MGGVSFSGLCGPGDGGGTVGDVRLGSPSSIVGGQIDVMEDTGTGEGIHECIDIDGGEGEREREGG